MSITVYVSVPVKLVLYFVKTSCTISFAPRPTYRNEPLQMRLYRALQRLPGLPAEFARDRSHLKRRHANTLRPKLSRLVNALLH